MGVDLMPAAVIVPAAPIVKFVGGKRALLPEILPRLPPKIDTYLELFVGGGAIFFALANEGRFKRAIIGDTNANLINMYKQVRDRCDLVIRHLREHEARNSEEHFIEQRTKPQVGPSGAARLIYLLRTCYNGLYRVNQSGEFNTPYGKYTNPRIVDVEGLRAASAVLQGVKIVCGDFAKLLDMAGVGDAVYCDPPYLPLPGASSFTAYDSAGFGIEDHERLAASITAAVKRGANCLLSNSDCPESRRIFTRGGWQVDTVMAKRNVNSKGDGRGAVREIMVTAPKRRVRVVK